MKPRRSRAKRANPRPPASTRNSKRDKPCGVAEVDQLATLDPCTLDDYLRAASVYVRRAPELTASQKKAAQIRLSFGLGKALLRQIETRLRLVGARAGEHVVSGALRTVNADVSQQHELDGLRLAVEIKPVNLAVGRAIWNRFGDIRTFAVNLHLRFPFAVVGGVLAIPTWEVAKTKGAGNIRKPTTHLIQRAVSRLVRAGGRKTEGDAAHLLEGIAVVVYDPDTAQLHPTLPGLGSGLRWDEFIEMLAAAYESRFETEEEIAAQTEGEAEEEADEEEGDRAPRQGTPGV